MQKMKPQMKLVIILNFVIVALITGLFFYYKAPASSNAPPASDLPDIYTSWQVDTTGKNEVPIAAFTAPDMNSVHVFGNCNENGENKIFFAEVADGEQVIYKILDFTEALSQSPNKIYGFELKKVCIAEVGYMLALQGYINTTSGKIDVAFVAATDSEGNVIKADVHIAISPERVSDAFYADGKLFMIVQTGYSDMNINNIKIYRYSTDVTLETSLSADHLGNMEYLFISPYRQGYLLCFNVKSLTYNCVAFAYLVPGTNATFSYAQMKTGYRATDFTVYKNGYALMCIDEFDNSFMLKLTANFEISSTSYFPGSGNKYESGILYTPTGYFVHCGTSKSVYKYDETLNESSEVFDCEYLCDSFTSQNITVVSSIDDGDVKLSVFGSSHKNVPVKLSGKQTLAFLLGTSSGLTLVTDCGESDNRGFSVLKLNGDALTNVA